MPVTVVVGAQWGDEGKGKLVDIVSANVDIVARCQGECCVLVLRIQSMYFAMRINRLRTMGHICLKKYTLLHRL